MYRVLDTITMVPSGEVIEPGAVGRLEQLSARSRERLLAAGVIAPVAMPPLAILPGWESRAARLAKTGILTANHLLDANAEEAATALHVRAETVQKWQSEILEYLNVR